MPSQSEVPLLLRQFRGVNVAQDAAFLDPGYLQASQNWHPDLSFVLTKRRGTAYYTNASIGSTGIVIDALKMAYSATGAAFLYSVIQGATSSPTDYIQYSRDPALAQALPTNSAFASLNARYGMAVLGSTLYVGNGIDPLKSIPLTHPTTATDLVALASTTTTGSNAVATADTTSKLENGTYSYCWAVYNTSTKLYVSRGAAQSVTLSGARSRVTFTAPSTALGANQVYLLFVAPRNLPVEFGHSQVPAGLAASATWDMSDVGGDGTPAPVKDVVVRTGRFLAVHRSRLFLAGDQSALSKVYSTGVLVPGLEQASFDQGQFFPANAVLNIALNDGDDVTGLGVATATDVVLSPTAPLLIFKTSSTWALFGDILDDDSASLVQLSGHVGCIAHGTVVNTPVGVLFCGLDSVYLIRPDALVPIDVGWPIAPVIRAIPFSRRAAACAIYHKGFYKLAVSPVGGQGNTQQWWLDLRAGLGQTTPSWWGPHDTSNWPVVCMTTAQREANEQDRAFAAANTGNDGNADIVILDQANAFTDGNKNIPTSNFEPLTIVSSLRTKSIDAGQPFQRKLFKRVRVNGRVEAVSELQLNVVVDGGVAMMEPDLTLTSNVGMLWDTSEWDTSEWTVAQFVEGESIFNSERARGRSIELTIGHSQASRCDLRDFELRYEPLDRPVRGAPTGTD